ncbi:4-fold beta flower protein [uncultured Variovorax sp.]|uniref:4-fold beta flower protein n=1 Tax=uncultured Variovorax sp. TaxID=114708 RepID=UPI0025F91525|nr:hypothetical protein [uncultured Variovorax sp.]
MDVWTWSGKYFGYFEDEYLFTHDGKHVGRLDGVDIYDQQGCYLGEVDGDRLITNNSKANLRSVGFIRSMNRVPQVRMVNYVGNVMYAGYQDFPAPENFR